MKPRPTPTEQELLDLVLREVRHATATGEQLSITVDPFAHTHGCHVFVSYNQPGLSWELNGKMLRRKIRGRRPIR